VRLSSLLMLDLSGLICMVSHSSFWMVHAVAISLLLLGFIRLLTHFNFWKVHTTTVAFIWIGRSASTAVRSFKLRPRLI